MYNILNKEKDDNTNNNTTVVTQMAATATTGSMIGSTYAATPTTAIPAEVTAAINQLLANQPSIMQQMAAMSFSPPPSITASAFNVPLI